MSQEQYVYNGAVVVMTGRKARKDQEAMTATRRRTATVDELYEITPLDKEDGSWKKWVRMTELYEIVEGNDE
jgi:hypothetical protein